MIARKAPYGSVKAMVSSLRQGEPVVDDFPHCVAMRRAAIRMGMKCSVRLRHRNPRFRSDPPLYVFTLIP